MMRALRVLLRLLGVVVALLVIAVLGVYFASSARLNRVHTVAAEPLVIPSDAATIARGRHLAVAVAHCTGCHTDNLAGRVMGDVPPFRLVAANLTHGEGGLSSTYSDADYVRAIRYGVKSDGTSPMVMPSENFAHLSDADLAAIIAYVKSVPQVDTTLPTSTLHPLGRALLTAGKLDVLSAEAVDPSVAPMAVSADTTPAYGQYLVTVGGCQSCHGANFTGGTIPDGSGVQAPNITPAGLSGWNAASFVTAMRTGVAPDGHTISEEMPWRAVGQLSDDELRAVWLYLESLPVLTQ